MESIQTFIPLVLPALLGVFVLINALYGLIRGMNKSVIRLITILLAMAVTFAIASPVTKLILENVSINGQTVKDMILAALNDSEDIAFLLNAAPLMKEAILAAPAFGLAFVVFPVVFYVLKFLSWILFLFVQKPLRKLIFKDSCNKQDNLIKPMGIRVAKRFAGMGVGMITGALIFAMLLTPMLGLFTIFPSASSVNTLLDTMADQGSMPKEDVETIKGIYGITDSPVVNILGSIGFKPAGKAYLHSVSKFEADGFSSSLAHELTSLISIGQTALENGALEILNGGDNMNAIFKLAANKEFMDSMMQSMFQSKILCSAVPELTAYAMEMVANAMQVPANKEAVYDNMMDKVAEAVKNADIDYAAIKAYEQANNITDTVIQLTNGTQTYAEGEIMTKEEYEAAVEKLVELAKTISSVLNKSLSGDNAAFTDSVAVHLVKGVQAQAAEFGQDAVTNFDANNVQNTISSMTTTDSNNSQLLEQLTDKEKFQTDAATVETIKASILESVKAAVSDDTKAAETASTLASVVSDFAGAVASATGENGEMDITKMDFEKIGNAVTTLQNSNLKGVGSSVLEIVSSGELAENPMIKDAMEAVKEGYENGEDIGGTIGTAGALINFGTAMGGGNDGANNEEAMVNSLTSLINNLNEFTIKLLPKIISTDTLVSMGLPKEYAEPAFKVVETLLTELMKLKDSGNYDKEVETILYFYNLATSGVDKFTETEVSDLVNYALQSDAIYNTLLSVTDSNPFGIKIPDEAAKADVVAAIEMVYEKSHKGEREKNLTLAIAKLLGVDGDIKIQ